MKTKFEDIDLKIEKLVFLLNADEGNPGIYELVSELGCFDLALEDKYKIARLMLTEIIQEDLVVLEKYRDNTLAVKLEIINKKHVKNLLNDPFSWYPCNEAFVIILTKKGEEYLDQEMPKFKDVLDKRYFRQ